MGGGGGGGGGSGTMKTRKEKEDCRKVGAKTEKHEFEISVKQNEPTRKQLKRSGLQQIC